MTDFITFVCCFCGAIVLVVQYIYLAVIIVGQAKMTKTQFRNRIIPIWGICFCIIEYYNQLEEEK
jgi:hypothetical protein